MDEVTQEILDKVGMTRDQFEKWFLEKMECSTSDPKLRKAIFKVYKGKCFYTGRPLQEDSFHIDHVWPSSKGGPDNICNYVPVDPDVNLGKHDKVSFNRIYPMLYHIKVNYAQKVLNLKNNEIGKKQVKTGANYFDNCDSGIVYQGLCFEGNPNWISKNRVVKMSEFFDYKKFISEPSELKTYLYYTTAYKGDVDLISHTLQIDMMSGSLCIWGPPIHHFLKFNFEHYNLIKVPLYSFNILLDFIYNCSLITVTSNNSGWTIARLVEGMAKSSYKFIRFIPHFRLNIPDEEHNHWEIIKKIIIQI